MEGAYAVFLEELGSRTLRRVACEEGIGLVGELLELGEVLGLDAVLERVEVWRLPYDGQRGKREGEGSDFDRLELAEVGAAFGQELDAPSSQWPRRNLSSNLANSTWPSLAMSTSAVDGLPGSA